MTLILAVLTDDYVAMASDRRITVTRGSKLVSQEDTDTKTFNLLGHFLMGFTGLARIDGYRMERRLADTLSGVEPRDYFEAVAEDFTAIFKRLGHAGVMPHAFLAVGFARTGSDPSLKPLSIKVSNCMDQMRSLVLR